MEKGFERINSELNEHILQKDRETLKNAGVEEKLKQIVNYGLADIRQAKLFKANWYDKDNNTASDKTVSISIEFNIGDGGYDEVRVGSILGEINIANKIETFIVDGSLIVEKVNYTPIRGDLMNALIYAANHPIRIRND